MHLSVDHNMFDMKGDVEDPCPWVVGTLELIQSFNNPKLTDAPDSS